MGCYQSKDPYDPDRADNRPSSILSTPTVAPREVAPEPGKRPVHNQEVSLLCQCSCKTVRRRIHSFVLCLCLSLSRSQRRWRDSRKVCHRLNEKCQSRHLKTRKKKTASLKMIMLKEERWVWFQGGTYGTNTNYTFYFSTLIISPTSPC